MSKIGNTQKPRSVVLGRDQPINDLTALKAGTLIAVEFDSLWWPYISSGAGRVLPAGELSYPDSERAINAASAFAKGG